MTDYVHLAYDDLEDAPILLAGTKRECVRNAKELGGVVYAFENENEPILIYPNGEKK